MQSGAADRIATEIYDAIHDTDTTEGDVDHLRIDLKADIAVVRSDLTADIAGLRAEVKGDIADVCTDIR